MARRCKCGDVAVPSDRAKLRDHATLVRHHAAIDCLGGWNVAS